MTGRGALVLATRQKIEGKKTEERRQKGGAGTIPATCSECDREAGPSARSALDPVVKLSSEEKSQGEIDLKTQRGVPSDDDVEAGTRLDEKVIGTPRASVVFTLQ